MNAAYDGGATDAELFDNSGANTNLLEVGQSVTIQVTFEVDPDNATAITDATGNFVNQAETSGVGTQSGELVDDSSDDPNDSTDADNDGDNDADDPNLIRFPSISLQKQVAGTPVPASSGVAGNFDVFYDLTITNTGSTELDQLSLIEDFATQFGGGFVQIVST